MQILLSYTDIQPPEIKCLPVVTHYLNGTTSSSVTWSIPEVYDNRNATIMHTSGPSPGDVLTPGKYEVTYIAVDDESNPSKNCTITVNVLGMYQ